MNRYVRSILISTPLAFFLFAYLIYSETGTLPDYYEVAGYAVLSVFVVNVIGLLLVLCSTWLHKIVPWKRSMLKRFLLGLFFNNLITIPIGLSLIYLISILAQLVPSVRELSANYPDGVLKLSILVFFITFVYTVGDFLLYSYHQYTVVQIESVRLKRDQLRLQFDALRSQLTPHYLFNSLNTISSLVFRDVRLTEEFIRRLAQTYQYVFANKESNLVKLKEEMEFLEAYNFLLRVRFENAYQFSHNLKEEVMESWIPPLSLQMLVENAIKHNTISEDMPLHVEIIQDQEDFITVRNNYIGKPFFITIKNNLVRNPSGTASLKIGLENIKKRFQFYSTKEMTIKKDDYFTVKLPLITQFDEG